MQLAAKTLRTLFILSVLGVPTSCAWAGDVTGKVLTVSVRNSDGLQYVTISRPISGPPACATQNYFIIKDEKSDAGKAQFSMLLSAKLSGQVVQIVGAATCTRWGDGEDIDTVVIQP